MNKEKVIDALFIFGIPFLLLCVITGLFLQDTWNDFFSVMTVSFLFFLPFIAGAVTVYLSRVETVRSIAYRILAPWIPVLIFCFITLITGTEGWGCWIMILPVFLIIASIGGLYSGYIKLSRSQRNNRVHISVLILLPFFTAPIEQMLGTIPGKYEVFTSIDIQATPEKIWSNVTRVREIKPEQDNGSITQFLDFPRPVKAELNYEGAGATREAIFSDGLVFHEKVLSYEHQGKMHFSIKANPYEIPSTTMDEHIVVGGNYFDVLDGTYELQRLNETTYRLNLYSHFKLNTNFNFYASWWASWIMSDIQNNILEIIKERAENKNEC